MTGYKPSTAREPATLIPEIFITDICSRLAQDKQVRRILPLEGLLNIDRGLPFLCVYRSPVKKTDQGTEELVKSEASFLTASGAPRIKTGLGNLVSAIVRTLAQEYQAFLLLEIWSSRERAAKNNGDSFIIQPDFRVIMSRERPPTTTAESLGDALKQIVIQRRRATVNQEFSKTQCPPGFAPLLTTSEARKLNCYMLGLEVAPVYRNLETGDVFPLVLRRLQRGLSRAIKKGVFDFSHRRTNHRPTSYLALGKQALVKAVWKIDAELATISNTFDFLLQVTPVNIEQGWHYFKRHKYDRPPEFYYRPVPVDPALLLRKLYHIPIKLVEDPTLAFLFREKRTELDRQISMLRDRNTRNFLYGGLQLYGPVEQDLHHLAMTMLEKISPYCHEQSGKKKVNARGFAARAREEIDYYKRHFPAMTSTVHIRDDITGLMVSRGNLLIGKGLLIAESRIRALLQHELGTHALTYINGRSQPFQQLYTGLAGYDELQEGIAVLAEFLVGGLSLPRLRLLAGRVIAAASLVAGAYFMDTFRLLNKEYGFSKRISYTISARTYRGGGLTKDAVYLRGLAGVLDYIAKGGALEPLLTGKIAAHHIRFIDELKLRRVLKPVPLLPRYFEDQEAWKKLEKLRAGLSVLDLVTMSGAREKKKKRT